MYSPRVFRDLMLPRLKRVSEACHQAGAYHLFGTDGDVWQVADDLYGRSGIDGHYELDRRAGMDILKIHERYPRITMIGNISSFTLHTGSPAEVAAETRACLTEAKQTNKVIAGCSNIIVSETPFENVEAMLETISKCR
jgi:uroporphyrinogen-III decarboxylase